MIKIKSCFTYTHTHAYIVISVLFSFTSLTIRLKPILKMKTLRIHVHITFDGPLKSWIFDEMSFIQPFISSGVSVCQQHQQQPNIQSFSITKIHNQPCDLSIFRIYNLALCTISHEKSLTSFNAKCTMAYGKIGAVHNSLLKHVYKMLRSSTESLCGLNTGVYTTLGQQSVYADIIQKHWYSKSSTGAQHTFVLL